MAEDAGFAQDLGTYSYFLMLSALTIVFFYYPIYINGMILYITLLEAY